MLETIELEKSLLISNLYDFPSAEWVERVDKYCRFHRIGSGLSSYFCSMIIRKGHPLFVPLSEALLALIDEGIIDDLYRRYPTLQRKCGETKKERLRTKEMEGLFLVVGSVSFCALGIALLKWCWNKRSHFLKR